MGCTHTYTPALSRGVPRERIVSDTRSEYKKWTATQFNAELANAQRVAERSLFRNFSYAMFKP